MTITVKFFASLSEELGKTEVQLKLTTENTLQQVWQQATNNAKMPAKLLMAINMEYAKADAVIADGDEVAFFPPVTGG